MAVNRYYSSTAVSTTLTAGIAGGATSITVASVAGFPVSYPYTLILDPDGTEELVKVTAAAGTTLTVARGQDGTSAVAHNSGDTVRHGVSAQDYREPQEHIAATTDIHGLAGGASVVGTSSSQTLTNKTLTTPTIGSLTNAQHTHANAAGGGTVAHSALTGLTTGDPHTQYQQESEKAAASGYASLDGTTKVPIAQLPTGNTATTVAKGTAGGYVAEAALSGLLSLTGTIKTLATTADFATDAGVTYMVMATWSGFDPSTNDGVTFDFSIEESLNSGGAWGFPTMTASSATAVTTVGNGTQSNTVGGGNLPIFVTPGAQATVRYRLRAVRGSGSIPADVYDAAAVIHVIRVGEKLF